MLIGRPVRDWTVEGLRCQTVPAWAGALNGYIQLPEGVERDAVSLPQKWTYGPDEDRWVGFDTIHSWDFWSPEDRRRFAEYLIDDEGGNPREAVEAMIEVHERYLDQPRAGAVLWTEKRLEAYVTQVAGNVARQLRGEVEEVPDRCPVHGTDEDPWACPIGILDTSATPCDYFVEEMNRRMRDMAAGDFWQMAHVGGEILFTEYRDYKPTGATRRFPADITRREGGNVS